MSQCLITTVGTSLLKNFERSTPGSPATVELLHDWISQVGDDKASAETNNLARSRMSSMDWVVLVHSDTDDGAICAAALGRYLERKVKKVSTERVMGLSDDAQGFEQGLKNLLGVANTAVHRAQDANYSPVFCITGGFKAQMAVLSLYAAMSGIPAYYVHERFSDIIELPSIPFWDPQFVTQHQALFEQLDGEPLPVAEMEARIKADPRLRSLVILDDDCYYLSVFGDLMYKAFRSRTEGQLESWPEASQLSPEDKNRLSKLEHERPQGWEAVVNNLCRTGYVTSVRYDEAAYARSPGDVQPVEGTGDFLCVYGTRDNKLPLRVSTTMKNPSREQRLVTNDLKGRLRLRR